MGCLKIEANFLQVVFGKNENLVPNLGIYAANGRMPENKLYFHHNNHLNGVSYISDASGELHEHLVNAPSGEILLDDRAGSYQERFNFTGKEIDEETGYVYMSARYMNPKIGNWLSVDPLWEKVGPSRSPYEYAYSNPIKFIDLNGMEPTPEEAAEMSSFVYNSTGLLSGGWKESKETFGLKKGDLNNKDTGLKSQIFERTENGKTEYTYATAGTEDKKDMKQDALQAIGLSDQYKQSVANAKIISDALKESGQELTFTGHSLGGGEAALNALVTDRKAKTFNAAGVSPITKALLGGVGALFKSESKIDAYIMTTDPLNNLQNNSPLPDVNGNRHYLTPTDASSIYNGHSIDNVIKSLQK